MRRTPAKLQLLAFRRVAENANLCVEQLEFINKSGPLRHFFGKFKFVVHSPYHILANGTVDGFGQVLYGHELLNYIKHNLSRRIFSVDFFCVASCNTYCSECEDEIHKTYTHLSPCESI